MVFEATVFGPCRAIGVRYAGKNENGEVMRLWGEFLPRGEEIATAGSGGSFGVCRCLPGVKDGSFEYVAGFAATPDSAIPAGMMAVDIPRGEYYIGKYESVTDYKRAWNETMAALGAAPEWTTYCQGPDRCQCAAHPSFEFYPPEFCGNGPVWFCIPVYPK